MERTGLPPESVDDVLLGHCYPTMEAPALGRVAALDAGLPVTAAGLQLDRRCGSGLQAVLDAAMEVQTGSADVRSEEYKSELQSRPHLVCRLLLLKKLKNS